TPALSIVDYPNPNAADAIFVGTSASNGTNFFKLTNLYQAAPTVAWSGSTGGLDGSAVALDLAGTRVYALDRLGHLNCFDTATGGFCAGWTARYYDGGAAVSLSSPWVEYGTGGVYFGDSTGGIHKVNGATGQLIWRVTLAAGQIRSSPLVIDG